MKYIIWSVFFVITYFSVFVYGCAWMNHEGMRMSQDKVPELERKIEALENRFNTIMPSAFKVKAKSSHSPYNISRLKRQAIETEEKTSK